MVYKEVTRLKTRPFRCSPLLIYTWHYKRSTCVRSEGYRVKWQEEGSHLQAMKEASEETNKTHIHTQKKQIKIHLFHS